MLLFKSVAIDAYVVLDVVLGMISGFTLDDIDLNSGYSCTTLKCKPRPSGEYLQK